MCELRHRRRASRPRPTALRRQQRHRTSRCLYCLLNAHRTMLRNITNLRTSRKCCATLLLNYAFLHTGPGSCPQASSHGGTITCSALCSEGAEARSGAHGGSCASSAPEARRADGCVHNLLPFTADAHSTSVLPVYQVPDCCACAAEEQRPSKVVAQAQEYEAQAQGHAQAQSQLVVHAHNLTAKAHAHANAQVSPTLVCLPYCSMFHIGLYWSHCHIKLPGSDLSIIPLLCRHKLRHRPIRLLRRRATSMRPHRGCRLRQT